ncbi:hypothetical protein [Helicovermis profundi]|uniref:PH domain-containing protein n=1 Tax=Helicovermis profundi TaxID=3065157 RepID=A0AAU9E4Q1_9FIRM|nr:hypothetical protein HLPR_19200 [Clostridia bacterium S502]
MREKIINQNMRVHLKFKKSSYFIQLAMLLAILYFGYAKLNESPENLKVFYIILISVSFLIFLNSIYKDYRISKNVEKKDLVIVKELIDLKNINNFARLPKIKLISKKISLTPLYGLDVAKFANKSCYLVYDPKTKTLVDIYKK